MIFDSRKGIAATQIAVVLAAGISFRPLPPPAPDDLVWVKAPFKPASPPGVPPRLKARLQAMPPAFPVVKSLGAAPRPDLLLEPPPPSPALSRTEACVEFTKPDSLRIFLFGTSHNHRAPPA